MTELRASAERIDADLYGLAEIRDDSISGWTRQVFSEPYREARPYVERLMESVGLETRVDAIGNIIGRLPGTNPLLKPIVTGSHTDTVPHGGRFDGVVGVIGAIEAVRLLRENGIRLEHDLLVIDYLGEESNVWSGGLVGSTAINSGLTASHLDRVDTQTGVRMGDAMARFGLDPSAAISDAAWQPDSVHASIELHVEQGPVLERTGSEIGVVTAIVGQFSLLASFMGRGDHAGTMPMEMRSDALLAAAEAVLTVEQEACGAPIHAVGTTGRIEALPGAMNLVPGEARMWIDMRSIDPSWLSGARRRLADRIAEQAAARGVETAFDVLSESDVVPTVRGVQDIIADSAEQLGYSWEAIPSGAGHDSQNMARLGPMGMIFIPSVGGRSHVPEEFTHTADIVKGVEVLTRTILEVDRVPRLG